MHGVNGSLVKPVEMAAWKLQVCARDSERAAAAEVLPYQVATGWVCRLVRSW